MGAFNKSQRPSIKVEGHPGWDNGEWVQIKGVVTAEDMEEITTQKTTIGPDGRPQATADVSMVAAMQRMIDDWVLLGDGNRPVDLYELNGNRRRKRVEIIGQLPAEYTGPIMQAIGDLINKSAVQQPEDFTNSASELTAVSLHVVK